MLRQQKKGRQGKKRRERKKGRQKKNHTHMEKVGHTSEFPFGIYWWTLKNLKNQNFEKMKKNAGDIIILHVYQKPQSYEIQFLRYRVRQSIWALNMCTINQDHMMYGSWDIKCKGQSFISFCIFCPLTPPSQKN